MKKTITLFCMLMAMFSGVRAQYYYIPHLNAGTNPGGLNNDIEQPSATGWTTIQATSATPVWSSNATIPFSFTFNGNSYTTLKASTSGVVTFTTSAVPVPSSTSAALPDASIPDNSICVWGLAGSGSNDKIWTKTFGTTPNRQFWIQYNSYSCPGSTGWTYWAVVLEETSNKIYVVDQRSYNAPLALSIGIQIDASTAVSVTGSPSLGSNATATADDTPIDNSYFEFIPGSIPANDANLSNLTPLAGSTASYGTSGSNVDIKATLTNYGSATITGVTFKYSDGTNTYTDNVSGLNLASMASTVLTHSTPFTIPAIGTYNITAWFELTGDLNQTNDSGTTVIQGISFVPTHVVVFEEATGTWCGWCPRGAVFMDSMKVVHPNEAILIAVHNADPMVNAPYDNGVGAIVSGYPSVLVNRNIVADPSDMFNQFNDHIGDFGVADLTVTCNYDAVSHATQTDVSAHFAVDLAGDYRLAVVFTEDNLTGTTSTWAQANYYSFQSQNLPLQGAGHNWQAEPSTIPAANMEYDHVARTILGGFNGQSGSLPATIVAGATHSYSFNYTIPATSDITRMHVYALLIDVANSKILNGKEGNIVLGVDEAQATAYQVSVFPNPTEGNANLYFNLKSNTDMTVQVVDLLGNVVQTLTPSLPAGNSRISLDLADYSAGIYNIRISAGGETISRKLVVSE